MRALALACLALVGCSPRAGTLSVDLVTDLVPGNEIFVARTTVTPSGAEPEPSSPVALLALDPSVDFTEGGRIAELRDLPPGNHRATIELLGELGDVIVTRRVEVRVAASVTIRVVVTRDCLFLGCPGVGDPETSTECLGGHCIDPACAEGSCASAECQTDGDCPVPVADCAANLCRDGVCLAFETRGACEEGTACSPDIGCVVVVTPIEPMEDLDGDGAIGADDCNAADPTIAAGAPEICGDGIDQNCSAGDLACPPDVDGDGWDAYSDCNDGNTAINPAEEDVCGNGVDEDCDQYDPPCTVLDNDHDEWSQPNDCNDSDSLTHPYAFDICGDGVDQDCDGSDPRAPCVGGYGQACGPRGTCLSAPRQRLACTRANGAARRACLRCCVICENQSRFHWLNVDYSCSRAAARYCARNGRGGLLSEPGIDPVQWGTCSR